MIILYFLCANVNTLFYLYKSLWKKLQKKAVFYFVLSKTCTTFALKKKNKRGDVLGVYHLAQHCSLAYEVSLTYVFVEVAWSEAFSQWL